MKVVNLSEKPSLLNQYLKEMRSVDVQKDSMRFRRNIERIGEIMAVEISKQLTYAVEQVQTPLAIADMEIPQDQVVLGTLLRAGLPMHQAYWPGEPTAACNCSWNRNLHFPTHCSIFLCHMYGEKGKIRRRSGCGGYLKVL